MIVLALCAGLSAIGAAFALAGVVRALRADAAEQAALWPRDNGAWNARHRVSDVTRL